MCSPDAHRSRAGPPVRAFIFPTKEDRRSWRMDVSLRVHGLRARTAAATAIMYYFIFIATGLDLAFSRLFAVPAATESAVVYAAAAGGQGQHAVKRAREKNGTSTIGGKKSNAGRPSSTSDMEDEDAARTGTMSGDAKAFAGMRTEGEEDLSADMDDVDVFIPWEKQASVASSSCSTMLPGSVAWSRQTTPGEAGSFWCNTTRPGEENEAGSSPSGSGSSAACVGGPGQSGAASSSGGFLSPAGTTANPACPQRESTSKFSVGDLASTAPEGTDDTPMSPDPDEQTRDNMWSGQPGDNVSAVESQGVIAPPTVYSDGPRPEDVGLVSANPEDNSVTPASTLSLDLSRETAIRLLSRGGPYHVQLSGPSARQQEFLASSTPMHPPIRQHHRREQGESLLAVLQRTAIRNQPIVEAPGVADALFAGEALYSPWQRTTDAAENDVQESIAASLDQLSISALSDNDINTGPPRAPADSDMAGDGEGGIFLGRNSVWIPLQASATVGGHSRGAVMDPAARDGQQHGARELSPTFPAQRRSTTTRSARMVSSCGGEMEVEDGLQKLHQTSRTPDQDRQHSALLSQGLRGRERRREGKGEQPDRRGSTSPSGSSWNGHLTDLSDQSDWETDTRCSAGQDETKRNQLDRKEPFMAGVAPPGGGPAGLASFWSMPGRAIPLPDQDPPREGDGQGEAQFAPRQQEGMGGTSSTSSIFPAGLGLYLHLRLGGAGATRSGRYGSAGSSFGNQERGSSPTGAFSARSSSSNSSHSGEQEGHLLQASSSELQEGRMRVPTYDSLPDDEALTDVGREQLRVMVQGDSNNAANFPGLRAGPEQAEPPAATPAPRLPTPWPTNQMPQQQLYRWAVPPNFFEFGIGG
ncbi:unnamed protein product [Amoebophrya sp. A120]|nr:unnamed protein product [Amoebophrya sp. A120]|eukprot:GSA120T00015007001.1